MLPLSEDCEFYLQIGHKKILSPFTIYMYFPVLKQN